MKIFPKIGEQSLGYTLKCFSYEPRFVFISYCSVGPISTGLKCICLLTRLPLVSELALLHPDHLHLKGKIYFYIGPTSVYPYAFRDVIMFRLTH